MVSFSNIVIFHYLADSLKSSTSLLLKNVGNRKNRRQRLFVRQSKIGRRTKHKAYLPIFRLHDVSCWIYSTKLGQLSICLVFVKFCLHWAAQGLLRGTGPGSKPIRTQIENSWHHVSVKLRDRLYVWVRNLEVKMLNDVWFLSDTFLFSNWEIHQKNTTSALFILALKTNWDTKAP